MELFLELLLHTYEGLVLVAVCVVRESEISGLFARVTDKDSGKWYILYEISTNCSASVAAHTQTRMAADLTCMVLLQVMALSIFSVV